MQKKHSQIENLHTSRTQTLQVPRKIKNKAIMKFQNMGIKEDFRASKTKKLDFSKTRMEASRQWRNAFKKLRKFFMI